MSSLPTIGEWGNDLGQAFANIGQGVSNIINPYQKQEAELRSRIAANPKVLQELIDQETQNPGSVARLYGPNVAKLLQNRSSSTESRVEMATRDAIEKGRTSADIQGDKSALGQLVNRTVAGVNQATGRTQAATATTAEAQASTAGLEARNKELELNTAFKDIEKEHNLMMQIKQGQANTAKLAGDNALRMLSKQTQVSEADLGKLAAKYRQTLQGKKVDFTPEEQQIISAVGNDASPYANAWRTYLNGAQAEDSMAEQKRFHQWTMSKENQDLMGKVISTWKDLKSPGGSAVYLRDYMFDPKISARAKELYAQFQTGKLGELNKDDTALLDIEKAMQQNQAAQADAQDMKDLVQARLLRDEYAKRAKANDDQGMSAASGDLGAMYTTLARRAGQKNVTISAQPWKEGLFDFSANNLSNGDLVFYATTPDGKSTRITPEQLNQLTGKRVIPIGTGDPITQAYQEKRTGTIHAGSSEDRRSGATTSTEEERALSVWRALTPLQRTQKLRETYPDEESRKTAIAYFKRKGIEVK